MSLDERKQKILGAVVRDYVESIRPIGSEELMQRHSLGIKSATIRNELAELAELGYLKQPHTSAGRIPSDRGYRFYVDHLMIARRVKFHRSGVSGQEDNSLELDRILRLTCSMLTRYTSYTSVATPPRPTDTTINHIFVTVAGDGRLLIVALFSTGQIDNRIVSEPGQITTADLISLNNALVESFAGRTLQRFSQAGENEAIVAPNGLSARVRTLFDITAAQVCQIVQDLTQDDSVMLEGTREMLRQPEFRDIERLETMLESFQGGASLFQMLSQTVSSDVTVVIGEENGIPAMHDCSIITAPYYAGSSERGSIGVVGPTRMDYDRTVPAVHYFARSLSQTLSRLGRT